jgi:hypothetical protein
MKAGRVRTSCLASVAARTARASLVPVLLALASLALASLALASLGPASLAPASVALASLVRRLSRRAGMRPPGR